MAITSASLWSPGVLIKNRKSCEDMFKSHLSRREQDEQEYAQYARALGDFHSHERLAKALRLLNKLPLEPAAK
ncbi:hypothetical protein H4219_002089 [Mycoemilia scoparia]|uniref:Uncharacterized protein n=1 Tax=Mycoemilia scoparia TaxID=417184 RepID=A0A9W7ZZ74_9FUNG|nr:hypothetical protein H4219_002089 [Mycoemilia scoparia]